MSDQSYTAQQAADPRTPAQVLADIAAVRPDLRPAVASNPSAYPSLLEWLGSLGEPTVDAALKARAAAAPEDVRSTAILPTAGAGDSAGPAGATAVGAPSGQSGQPGQNPQAGEGGQPPFGTTPPYGAQQPGYGAQPGHGGQQPGTPGYGSQPTSAYGTAPGYAGGPAGTTTPGYAGYQPAPQKSGSKKALWIVLGILGFLLLLAVIAFFVIRSLISNALPDIGEGSYGDDPALDQLWDACEAEDWGACDTLYQESPIGSEYERFGDTCGNRMEEGTQVFCVDEFGDAAPADEPADLGDTETEEPAPDTATEPFAYGDDPALDALYDQCGAGDLAACDELWNSSPAGSEYEAFADTCGGTTDGGTSCDAGTAEAPTANTYGDDPALDALWDACAAEDWAACDTLYQESAVGSEYETFGDTCGNRMDAGTQVFCTDQFG